ncbi:hypothetical protein VOLCADRAFT_116515, partial [Volvox carteri f. nagariensis]
MKTAYPRHNFQASSDGSLSSGAGAAAGLQASPGQLSTRPSGTKNADRLPTGGINLEEHFTDEQLRLWNITKLLQRLAAAAAEDPCAALPPSPAAGSGARAASHLVRRSLSGGAAGEGNCEGAAVNSRKQVSECAVSLEFLLEFAREVPEDWRTGRVVQELVQGFTQTHKCRFADLMPARHVKRPDYFISHKWDSPFHYLVRSHPGEGHDSDLVQVSNAITTASGGTLVVLDRQAGPLGRVWCLFEIWITVREKGLGSLHLLTYGFTNNDIRDCFE